MRENFLCCMLAAKYELELAYLTQLMLLLFHLFLLIYQAKYFQSIVILVLVSLLSTNFGAVDDCLIV